MIVGNSKRLEDCYFNILPQLQVIQAFSKPTHTPKTSKQRFARQYKYGNFPNIRISWDIEEQKLSDR